MIPAIPVGDRSEEETVRRIASLARLELTPKELGTLGSELASVLAAFEALSRVEVAGIAPMISPADGPGSSALPRDDRAVPGLERAELLARAPATSPGPNSEPGSEGDSEDPQGEVPRYFRVPPAIAPEQDGSE